MSVEQVSKTQIAVWNSGVSTMHGQDIVAAAPLKFVFPSDVKILAYSMVSTTNKANNFKLEVNNQAPNELIYTFDYLDRKDGVIIEIVHTGNAVYVRHEGKVKGMPGGVKNKGSVDFPLYEEKIKKSFWSKLKTVAFLCILSALYLVFLTYTYFAIDKFDLFDNFPSNLIPVYIGTFICAALWYRIEKHKNMKFPKKLLSPENKC